MTSHDQPTFQLKLHSEITCPSCGYRKLEEMPTDACQYSFMSARAAAP